MSAFYWPGYRVELTPKECWHLYTWLGDAAPFVRNQLNVMRHGGNQGGISLSTPEERREVQEALRRGNPQAPLLSEGLLSLWNALEQSNGDR